ncbi:hypothetical protein F5Y18DRAFT_429079 [Xylariaceae sp. FL1019]|nr:hypothetical protein F5Y18DRAFT_429079 [Xylariaceae sp. FL1019]
MSEEPVIVINIDGFVGIEVSLDPEPLLVLSTGLVVPTGPEEFVKGNKVVSLIETVFDCKGSEVFVFVEIVETIVGAVGPPLGTVALLTGYGGVYNVLVARLLLDSLDPGVEDEPTAVPEFVSEGDGLEMPFVVVSGYPVLLFSREDLVTENGIVELDIRMLEPMVMENVETSIVAVSGCENDTEALLLKTLVEVVAVKLVELTAGLDMIDAAVEPSIVMLLGVRELDAMVEAVDGILVAVEDATKPDVRLYDTKDVVLLIDEAVSDVPDDILGTLPIVDDAFGTVEVALIVALGSEYGALDEATSEPLLMTGVMTDGTIGGALVETDNGYGPELELVEITGLRPLDARLDWLPSGEVIVDGMPDDALIGVNAVVEELA